MDQAVIVTGGSGFLGSVLVEQLVQEGFTVHNLDLRAPARDFPEVRFHAVDIFDAAQLAVPDLPSDAHVIHLAGRQYSGPVKRRDRTKFFHDGNVTTTRNIIDLASKLEARSFSFVSTDMVYGTPECTPVGTDHPRRPFGPYGKSKVQAEDIIARSDLPFRTLIYRPRLIVGPGRFGLMAKLFEAIRRNMPVPMIGNGRNRYQMISVFDCADAIRRGVDRPEATGVFNLGSDSGQASRDLLTKLIAEVGSRSFVVPIPSTLIKPALRLLDRIDLSPLVPEQFEIADEHYVLDVARTRDCLEWRPVYGDSEMMLAAYKEYCSVQV